MKRYNDEDIDAFLGNTMPLEEREQFKAELDRDAELRENVTIRHLIIEAQLSKAEESILSTLQAPLRQKRIRRRIIGAIAIAAVLTGLLFAIGNSYTYSPNELYKEYYVRPTIEPSRGGKEKAQLHLKNGLALLEEGRPQDALAELLQVEVSSYSEDADWGILCCYLQMGDRSCAKAMAEKIVREQGYYAEEAKVVLKKLEERRWF